LAIDNAIIPDHQGPEKIPTYDINNKEIPILQNYSMTPNEKFWDLFLKEKNASGSQY